MPSAGRSLTDCFVLHTAIFRRFASGHTEDVNAIVVLGVLWLLGAGLFAPLLFGPRRRDEWPAMPARFDHLRASSTYRQTSYRARAHTSFR